MLDLLEKEALLVGIGGIDKATIRQHLEDKPRAATAPCDLSIRIMEESVDIFQLSGQGVIVVSRQDPLFRRFGAAEFLAEMNTPVLLL